MTPTGYLLAKSLKTIGFPFTQHRLQHAASELQLLRESEMILGFYTWEKVKNLEQFEQESAAIKTLINQKEQISAELTSWKSRVDKVSDSSNKPKNLQKGGRQQLIAQHHNIASRADSIISKSELIINEAKEVRHAFNKKTVTIQEMTSRDDPAYLIENEKETLAKLKQKFNQLKAARQKNDQSLAVYSQKLESLEAQIHAATENPAPNNTTNDYQTIGQANQKIAALQLQDSNIDTELKELYSSLGKQISKDYFIDSQCKKAVKNKASLIKIMAALRRSIEYNHHIAGR